MTKKALMDARTREMVKAELVRRFVSDELVDRIWATLVHPKPYSMEGWKQAVKTAVDNAANRSYT
jgi:hypothetical protein